MEAKPTAKELRDYCKHLGITAKSAGKPLKQLLEDAEANDDPKAFLELYAPVGAAEQIQKETPDPPAEKKIAKPSSPTVKCKDISVTMPCVVSIPNGVYTPDAMHLDVHLRKQATARAFKRVWMALLQQHAKLSNGRPVYSAANVVEWLVEQIAEEMETE